MFSLEHIDRTSVPDGSLTTRDYLYFLPKAIEIQGKKIQKERGEPHKTLGNAKVP